jgi:membrane-associated protease RseP (regulator of RpoE activity)
MKKKLQQWSTKLALAVIVATFSVFSLATASALESKSNSSDVRSEAIFLADEHSELSLAGERAQRKEVSWLGLSTEEASDALIAQLGLDPAVGLVVTYVAPESPAAQAGLQKHDVLVEFDGQALALPAQLRKLVQSRQIGDTFKLAYHRAGKKHSTSVTLGKTTPRLGLFGDEFRWQGDLRELQRHLRDLPISDTVREQMKNLRDSLGRIRIDHEEVSKEIRRSLDQARKSMQEALRQTTNTHQSLGSTAKILEELSQGGVELSRDATVTVKSSGPSTQTIVKTDETGVYVIIADPKKRLTAHDKHGQLLFDGEIETAEQQAKIPKSVWPKVEPMLRSMNTKAKLPQLEADELPPTDTF